MRILGVDPGTVICGYGVLDEQGGRAVVVTWGIIRAQAPGAREIAQRLQRVFRGISQVIEAYRPEALAIEEAFVWKNARSALAIGQGRAAAIVAAAEASLPVYEYQPSIVKKAVTGSGRAPKQQVQGMVRALLGIDRPLEPADAADALAVAFAHLHRRRVDALTRAPASAARPATAARARARREPDPKG